MTAIRLGALLPGSVLVGDGINGARRGTARTGGGDLTVIAKRVPEREIVIELLCAALGRHLGLQIPEPLLLLAEDDQFWFGSADIGYPSMRHFLAQGDQGCIERRLRDWPMLEKAASFDDLIANPDRHAGNLLSDGGGTFWLIDHGLCLRLGISPEAVMRNVLLDFARQGRDELALQRLKRSMIALAGTYSPEDFQIVVEQLPALPFVDDLVNFLVARLAHLSGIASLRLQPRQRDLDYGS